MKNSVFIAIIVENLFGEYHIFKISLSNQNKIKLIYNTVTICICSHSSYQGKAKDH